MLRTNTSLRGLADIRHRAKEQVIGQFHRSLLSWKRTHPKAKPFTARSGDLIGVFDGVWFAIKGERHICLIILLRPVTDNRARVRGLYLIKGDESEANWQSALRETLTPGELAQIRAIVADGSHGLVALSRQRGWEYQRCHFHLLKDLQLISGKRSGPTQHLRQGALELVKRVLDTPDERTTKRLKRQLAFLIARPDCPKTVRKKVGGFLKHFSKFRACYQHPALRLPHTSNSAECVGRFIRERLGVMRGLRTVHSLRYWLDILLQQRTTVQCAPKLPTKL
ncbi:hypothetical protein HY772_10510 [Candidatus Woesearchaeota archaeon]|nr:hypothetical protein [Candidatus Woesearchaeota archaeon]